MGASSAVILSLAHALVSYHGQTLAMDKYLYFSREIENLQHGRSSGLDLYLSLYGGAYFFTNGIASRRSISAFPLKVVNTGRPFSSTGQCVEHASKFFQSGSMLDEFAQTTIAMDKAWQKNRLDEFAQAVSKNHQLLCEIEVVPDTVKNFIGEVEKLGGAAKISGAGSVQGESGGIVLVVGDLDLNELSTKYGYEILAVRGMNGGLEIV